MNNTEKINQEAATDVQEVPTNTVLLEPLIDTSVPAEKSPAEESVSKPANKRRSTAKSGAGARKDDFSKSFQNLSEKIQDLWQELGQDARRHRRELETQIERSRRELDRAESRNISLADKVRDLKAHIERLQADYRHLKNQFQQRTCEMEQAIHEREKLQQELRISEHSAGIDVKQTEIRLHDELHQVMLAPLNNLLEILNAMSARQDSAKDVRKLAINFDNLCKGLRRKGLFNDKELRPLDLQHFPGGGTGYDQSGS